VFWENWLWQEDACRGNPPPCFRKCHYDDGSIMFRGGNLLALTELELRTVRGKEISLIHRILHSR